MSSKSETEAEVVRDPKNPHGHGDPNDRTLRKVERDVCVGVKLRDKAKHEKCVAEVAAFTECCKNSSLAMVLTCRKENANLKSCLTRWYNDEDFKKECEKEFLDERSEFRRTGVRGATKKYVV